LPTYALRANNGVRAFRPGGNIIGIDLFSGKMCSVKGIILRAALRTNGVLLFVQPSEVGYSGAMRVQQRLPGFTDFVARYHWGQLSRFCTLAAQIRDAGKIGHPASNAIMTVCFGGSAWAKHTLSQAKDCRNRMQLVSLWQIQRFDSTCRDDRLA
jgi:hypothetical protein